MSEGQYCPIHRVPLIKDSRFGQILNRSREGLVEAPVALVGEPLGVDPLELTRGTSVRRGKYPLTLKMSGRPALGLC